MFVDGVVDKLNAGWPVTFQISSAEWLAVPMELFVPPRIEGNPAVESVAAGLPVKVVGRPELVPGELIALAVRERS